MIQPAQIQCQPVPLLWVSKRRGDPFFNTRAGITAALTSGEYKLVIVEGGTVGPDAAAVTAGLTSGAYTPVIVDASADVGAGAVTAALSSGAYTLVVIDGGDVGPDDALVTAALSAGAYTLVIVSTTAPANAGNVAASLSSGSYVLA